MSRPSHCSTCSFPKTTSQQEIQESSISLTDIFFRIEYREKNGHLLIRYIVTKWIKSCLLQCFGTFKMPILMFISILVFRPEGQIWNPVRRDTRIYVRRILNAFRINKTQLNSSTISPSYKENVRFSTVDFHKLKWSRK